jgi:hypothetical protein
LAAALARPIVQLASDRARVCAVRDGRSRVMRACRASLRPVLGDRSGTLGPRIALVALFAVVPVVDREAH